MSVQCFQSVAMKSLLVFLPRAWRKAAVEGTVPFLQREPCKLESGKETTVLSASDVQLSVADEATWHAL